MHACTDSNGGNGKSFSNTSGHIFRHEIQHQSKDSRVFQSSRFTQQFVRSLFGTTLNFVSAENAAIHPRFVKKYANVGEIIRTAIEQYAQEVRVGQVPGPEHVFRSEARVTPAVSGQK
jgi:hypothetical protein